MRLADLTKIWITTHIADFVDGEEIDCYTNLRSVSINVQTDFSELDYQAYGAAVNELIKLRSRNLPDIKKGDMLYLSQPITQRTVEIEGESVADYGKGDYSVQAITAAYVGGIHVNNPTTITAKKVTR